MRSRLVFFVLLGPLVPSISARAALWSGILDPSRAIDWSNAGVPGGIPARSTQCGATVAPYSGSAAAINAAIASCPAGQYVHLGTGRFTLSSAVSFAGHGGVTLRGDGPLKTTLAFTAGSFCYSGNCDLILGAASNVYDGSQAVTPPCGGAGASNCATWSGGYVQGSTQIVLGNVGSNVPQVGSILFLDQANEPSDPGGLIQCDTPGPCSGNGGSFGRAIGGFHYSQVQAVRVAAINGSLYTVSPGIYANNIRAGQNPGAWWNSGMLSQAGVEDMTLDHSSSSILSGEVLYDCDQCWLKNVRSIRGGRNHVFVIQSKSPTIRDSYFFGVKSGGGEESYGIESTEASDALIENNIFDQISSPIMSDNQSGYVFGYNFSWNNPFSNPNFLQNSLLSHDAGNFMNLFEGNYVNAFDADNQHGASPLATVFRNWIPGQQPAPYNKTQQTQSFGIDANNRAYSLIGNVLGSLTCSAGTYKNLPCSTDSDCVGGGACTGPSYHTNYEASPLTSNASCNTSIYGLGWGSVGAGCSTPGPGETVSSPDPTVVTSMMRWGNYDTVTKAVRWNASEVPTTGVNFVNGNPVPATHSLPNSFYYASKPAWWASPYGTPPWPAVGPDVVGGAGPGGFAYQNPAYLCFAHGSFSNGMLDFDAKTCYGAGGGGSSSDIYLSQNGTGDGSSCSSSKSAAFFNNASNWGTGTGKIGPGVTAHLCGTFTGGAGANILTFRGGGTSGSPITLKWEAGAQISLPACSTSGCVDTGGNTWLVIDGNGTNPSITATANGTNLTNKIDSLGVKANGCSNCEIENLTITHMYDFIGPNDPNEIGGGINFTASRNIKVHDNVMDQMASPISGAYADGDHDVYVYNNTLDHFNHGIEFGQNNNNTAHDYFIYGNHLKNMNNWDTTADYHHHDGIFFYQNNAACTSCFKNIYVYDNLFDGDPGDTATSWIYYNSGLDGVYVYNNVLLNPANRGFRLVTGGYTDGTNGDKNFYVYNNYVDCNTNGGQAFGYGNGPGSVTGFTFINNAMSCGKQTVGLNGVRGTITIDHNVYGTQTCGGNPNDDNCLYFDGFISFNGWKARGFEAHGLLATNVGADSGGRPKTGSPMIHDNVNDFQNLTSLCAGGLGALCVDAAGVARPGTGSNNWDAGPYNFSGSSGTDTTPPAVSISAPTNGAVISGTINVAANASDNVAVANVQFKLDGVNLGSVDNSSPYSVSWDTTKTSNGSHILTAVATDTSGNAATSSAVMVTVSNSMGIPNADVPGLRDAFAYPNPAVRQSPVIRAMLGMVDSVDVTVFDMAGNAVNSGSLKGAPSGITAGGEYYYDYVWPGAQASGIYVAAIRGKKADGTTVRARVKFAVVR